MPSRNEERRLAKSLGFKRFKSQNACKKCGGYEFYISGGQCYTCQKIKGVSKENKEWAKAWRENNSEIHRNRAKKWRAENKEKHAKYSKSWKQENPGLHNAGNAKWRVSIRGNANAIADFELIEQFYRNCPKGMVVDHVIPIHGELVCGLHVSWNLQYMTGRQNSAKSNRVDLEIASEEQLVITRQMGVCA